MRIDLKRLHAHRARTFNLPPARRVASPAQASAFIRKRGFVFFWPIKGIDLPSLWTAVAGDRPVAGAHDDPGHVTWRWKDDALPKRMWYYAKILHRKATMISFDVVPFFYALSENYGSPEEDHLVAYEQGRLSQSARSIYDALLKEGPLDSISLRKAARLTAAKDSEWNRSLEDLQMDFKILPIGVAEAGAWKYAFIFQIVARHYPDLPVQSRVITETEARTRLLSLYFEAVGAAQLRDANRLFGWGSELTARSVARLVDAGSLNPASHPAHSGEWLVRPDLGA